MKIAIIAVFIVAPVVLIINFVTWEIKRYKQMKEAERFDVNSLPNDVPTWTPMSGLNRMANRKLNRMYKGGQL